MNRSIATCSFLALALSAFGATAAAEVPAPNTNGAPGACNGHDPAALLQRFDANRDGVLQLTELPARMQARLGGADANHDGALSTAEITAFKQARRAEHFARMDTNRDGAITAVEVGEQRWAFVGRADANHDGRVSQVELDQAHASGVLRGAHGMGHHGPPDPARMVQRFDANRDGVLQLTELPPRMQGHLAAADANHDGALSTAELTAAFQQFRARHGAPTQ